MLMLHRVRELLVRQRTMLVNALRGHLAELGLVTQLGARGVDMLLALVEDEDHDMITTVARTALLPIAQQLRDLDLQVGKVDKQILAW